MNKILLFEELSMNGHPALQTQFYDGWVLRFANGYTKRANSINPLYPSAINLETKIAECEKRYSTYDLPIIYKLTDAADPNLDKLLSEQGYTITDDSSYVMEMDLQSRDFSMGDCELTNHIDNVWLDSYFEFAEYTDKVKIMTARQIFENTKVAAICGRIVKSGVPVAFGVAVIERGFVGFLDIVVNKMQRGKGYGLEICQSLLSSSKDLGAHTAYLQVVQNNNIAVNLYNKIGYKTIYSYWYRVKNFCY
ncbi:MAG: GNAT family N-acetyltransferase [Defluviitaleaceae bacterium]|nr:GNAT family N-acetyltransferase [Defluviitaleaceae bacterium]